MKDREHSRGRESQRDRGEFSSAMTRLEKAVQEIVDVTTEELSGRATDLIDDTSKRLEAELRLRRVESESTDDDGVSDHKRRQRRQRHRYRHRFEERRARFARRTGRLYKDPSDEKIAGVCAGFARYFGVETWIVRMSALTGLIFLPGVVFPAYWIAYFIMDKKPPNMIEADAEHLDDGASTGNQTGYETRSERKRRQKQERREARRSARTDSVRPSAEKGVPPGRALRRTVTDLTQAELRLRRLESFVTSDRYELQKELHRIEREGSSPA